MNSFKNLYEYFPFVDFFRKKWTTFTIPDPGAKEAKEYEKLIKSTSFFNRVFFTLTSSADKFFVFCVKEREFPFIFDIW